MKGKFYGPIKTSKKELIGNFEFQTRKGYTRLHTIVVSHTISNISFKLSLYTVEVFYFTDCCENDQQRIMANNSPLYIAYLYKIYIQLGTMFHINYEPETVCFSTNTFKGFFKHTTNKIVLKIQTH